MPLVPIARTRSSIERGRDDLHVGLLDHGGQRLISPPARLLETWEVGAFAQLGDTQLDRAGARLPRPVTVAVALRQTARSSSRRRRLRSGRRPPSPSALGGKADHLAQQISVWAFSTSARRLIISSVIGGSSNQVGVSDPTLPANRRSPPQSRPLATALLVGRACGRLCSIELHHHSGRDRNYSPYNAQGFELQELIPSARVGMNDKLQENETNRDPLLRAEWVSL
jgi:hypothetical protein